MQGRKAKEKYFLVANYDSCALTVYGTHPKLISKPLIAYANQLKFNGFYGLSGRHFSKDIKNQTYNFLDFLVHIAAKKTKSNGVSIYTEETITSNYTTTQTTLNLEEATGLQCQAVSTAEDLLEGRYCGDGFEEVIKPYELEQVIPEDKMRIHISDLPEEIDLDRSKNCLLLQIAQHATALNPKTNITLDVIEDNKHCADAAKTLCKDRDWPTNVKLNVTLMTGKGDDATLNSLHKMKDIPARQESKMSEIKETKKSVVKTIKSTTKPTVTSTISHLQANSTFNRPKTRSMAKLESKDEKKYVSNLR